MSSYLTWANKDAWPLQWFAPRELACKGSGGLRVEYEAALKLDRLRERVGLPLTVQSAYRSTAHNKAVGGAPDSYHLTGRAFDIRWPEGTTDYRLMSEAIRVGFTGFGFYPWFLHLDVGPPRVWVGGAARAA